LGDIAATFNAVPEGPTIYFELPLCGPTNDLLEAIARSRGRAKVRTGGLTPDAVPASADLARFIAACARARIPFKATAGLHHPVRAAQPLTNAADSPRVFMHGFLNVFLASVLTYFGGTQKQVIETLEETSPQAFHFEETAVSWHGHRLTVQQIKEARTNLAIGFGSCSFEEPVADMKSLCLL
jgi:hypothetical protein